MKVFQLFFAFLLLAVSFVLAEDTGKKDEPLDHEKEHTFRSDEKKHMREEHQMDEGDFDEE